jgi:hypothetical protein
VKNETLSIAKRVTDLFDSNGVVLQTFPVTTGPARYSVPKDAGTYTVRLRVWYNGDSRETSRVYDYCTTRSALCTTEMVMLLI